MFNSKQTSPTQPLSTGKRAASASQLLKAKAPKLSSTLLGISLSLVSTLGLANMASANVSVSNLVLPAEPGYRHPDNTLRAIPTTIDGNQVNVYYDSIAAGTTEFCLQLHQDVSWWKGLKIFSGNNTLQGFIARTDEARGLQCDTFNTDELTSSGGVARLEIWKAKAFGVHTHVSTLSVNPLDVDGKRVRFFWINE
ncbi:MAG: hypothetical protein AAFY72_13005 [Cyanobacteria bacterium J06649_4]